MPGMIVAPQPEAAEAGARMLMAGGNAVDAAVTAAFVQTVVAPQMCGIAGYALLTMHQAGAEGPIAMDAPALAGAGSGDSAGEARLAIDMLNTVSCRMIPLTAGTIEQTDSGATLIPEPATLGLLAAGSLSVLRRRRVR